MSSDDRLDVRVEGDALTGPIKQLFGARVEQRARSVGVAEDRHANAGLLKRATFVYVDVQEDDVGATVGDEPDASAAERSAQRPPQALVTGDDAGVHSVKLPEVPGPPSTGDFATTVRSSPRGDPRRFAARVQSAARIDGRSRAPARRRGEADSPAPRPNALERAAVGLRATVDARAHRSRGDPRHWGTKH